MRSATSTSSTPCAANIVRSARCARSAGMPRRRMPETAAAQREPDRSAREPATPRPDTAAPTRAPAHAGPPPLRLAPGPTPATPGGGAPPSVAEAIAGPGEPLPAQVRDPLGRSLGVDVSRVRIHRDERANKAAADLGVRAYAYGGDVYLARGESPTDLTLLAHEVAHVVQQRSGPT